MNEAKAWKLFEKVTKETLAEHGHDHTRWELKWSDARSFAAKTEWYTPLKASRSGYVGRIRLNRRFVRHNDEQYVLDSVLHECAHVLAGHEAAHGARWKSWCVKVGANPDRFTEGLTPPARFVGRCQECGYEYPRERRLDGARCRAPLPNGDGKRSYLAGQCNMGHIVWERNDAA